MPRLSRLLTISAAVLTCAMCGCSKNQQSNSSSTGAASPAAQSTASPAAGAPASPAATASASAAPAASPTVAVSYTDLGGVFGADKILDLAHLGVFDSASGAFKPNDPITRRIFARWLFKANNALWAGDDTKQIRPASSGDPSSFKDLSNTDPDFPSIQGLQNGGISVGFPDKTFRPDQLLTREQMLAIKSLLDKGGQPSATKSDIGQAYFELPGWKDKKEIAPEYVVAINNSTFGDNGRMDNAGRVFGAIASLRPKAPVTRAQAAVLMWKIGNHQEYGSVTRTAREALSAPAPSAAP